MTGDTSLSLLRALLAQATEPGSYFWAEEDRMGIETGVDLTPEQSQLVQEILRDLGWTEAVAVRGETESVWTDL